MIGMPCEQTAFCVEVAPCLCRADLGRSIAFSIRWRKKGDFRTCSFSPALTAISVSAYDAQTPGVAASARYFGGIGELTQVWRLCTSGRPRDLGVTAGSSRQSHRLSVCKEDSHASEIVRDLHAGVSFQGEVGLGG